MLKCFIRDPNTPISGLRYFFSEADNSEAVLNGVELLRVELAGDDVLHHPAVLLVNIPARDTSG